MAEGLESVVAPASGNEMAGMDILDSFGLDSVATSAPPLPTDAPVQPVADSEKPVVAADGQDKPAVVVPPPAAAAIEAKPVAGAEASPDGSVVPPPVVAAAEPAVDDPDLRPEENKLVNSVPEAERPELQRRLKASRFEDHYKNQAKPTGEVVDYLATASPSQFEKLKSEIVTRALADPAKFALDLFTRAPDVYAKVANAVFAGDRKFFTKQITGRDDVDPDSVKTALEFFDRNKDRISESTDEDLTADELEEVNTYLPDISAKVKNRLAASSRAAEENKLLKQQLAEREQAKEKTATETQASAAKTLRAEQDAALDRAYGHVETFIRGKLEGPKGLNLTVTDAERKSAPDVANLKDLKQSILLHGLGELIPGFEKGLGEWGQEREDFVEAGKQLVHYANEREDKNAQDAAGKVIPFADTYLAERLKHPLIQWIDKQIQAATQKVGSAPALETVVTGAVGATGNKPAATYEELLDNFTPVR